MVENISLLEALTGFELPIKTLDERWLLATVDEVIQPGDQKIIVNEGMPIAGTQKRGNLIIEFKVQFPAHLNLELKNFLRLALSQKDGDQKFLKEIQSSKIAQESRMASKKQEGINVCI